MSNTTSAPTKISKFTPTKRLTKRQLNFIKNWTDFNSETFGNTYQSGIKAGFTDYSARVLSAHSHNIEWIQEAKKYLDNFTPEHIISALQTLSTSAKADRDKLNALSLLMKTKGMDTTKTTEVNISFVNSVPRPHIGAEAPTHNPIDIEE